MSGAVDLLSRAISPAEAVEVLGKRGVKVSERTLREKARRIGAYRELGQAMFFLPEDLMKIMEPKACSPQRSARKARSGFSAGPSTAAASKSAANGTRPQTPAAPSPKSSPSSVKQVTPIRLLNPSSR